MNTYRPQQLVATLQLLHRAGRWLGRSLLGLALFFALVMAVGTAERDGQHWGTIFRPAVLRFVAGANPYYFNSGFHNPPWVLAALAPLAAQPLIVGQVAMALACALTLYLIARRMGAGQLLSAALLLTPPVVFMYAYVNLDWLVALGLLLPAPLGLLAVLVKPQVGAGLALYWLVRAWQRGGVLGLALTAAPLALALVWSVLAFGPWYAATNASRLTHADWSLTWWPWTVPLGLALIGLALRQRRASLALLGGALLAPYMAFYSWAVAGLALMRSRRGALVALGALLLIGLVYPK